MPTLKAMFARVKWLHFLNLNNPTYKHLVRLFYANMTYNPGHTEISSYVLGHTIILNEDSLNDLLQASDGQPHYFYARKWPHLTYDINEAAHRVNGGLVDAYDPKDFHEYLSPTLRVVHYIISHVILPRSGHFTAVSQIDLAILFFLVEPRGS